MPRKKKDADEAGVARPDRATKRVVVEGEAEVDPAEPLYPARTPRDVALNKTKAGEDVGLEESKPDHTRRFFVTRNIAVAGRFVDGDGNIWELTGKRKDRPTVLSRSAILKDGGDPNLMNIPEDVDKFEVTGPVGNAQLTESGIVDSETGEVSLPEHPEDDLDNIEAVTPPAPGERPKVEATPLKAPGDRASRGKDTKTKPKRRKK